MHILLADDDRDDRFFFGLAVEEVNNQVQLTAVEDGTQLMLWLINNQDVQPDIIFLDLNMPRKNGFDCLDEIRHNRNLQSLFVAVYSTSTNPVDIETASAKGANLYINKPNGYEDLKLILRKVLELDLKKYSAFNKNEDIVLIPLPKW